MWKHKKLFYLNTALRTSGSANSSNFSLKIDIPQEQKFTHACVIEANIPKSYYLIQTGHNTFVLSELGVQSTVTILPGNYSASSFAYNLAAALNTASTHTWVYTVSLPISPSPLTGKYTYTVVGSGQPSFIFTTDLYEQLGFNANSTNTFAAGNLTSRNCIRMQSEDALYLHSDIAYDGILQEIYTNGVPDGGIINYSCIEHGLMEKQIATGGGNLYSFSLTDEFGTVIDLNGLNWNMTLAVFAYPDKELSSASLPKTLTSSPGVETSE